MREKIEIHIVYRYETNDGTFFLYNDNNFSKSGRTTLQTTKFITAKNNIDVSEHGAVRKYS